MEEISTQEYKQEESFSTYKKQKIRESLMINEFYTDSFDYISINDQNIRNNIQSFSKIMPESVYKELPIDIPNNFSYVKTINEVVNDDTTKLCYVIENTQSKVKYILKIGLSKSTYIQNEDHIMKYIFDKMPNNKYVPYLYASYIKKNYIFIITEYSEEGDLYYYIIDNPSDENIIAKILKSTALCMQALHSINIVHNDIKPENIVISEMGTNNISVKIIDFELSVNKNSNTEKFMSAGTPTYFPLEKIYNKIIDNRTDIWALGILAYVLAYKQLPPEVISAKHQLENKKSSNLYRSLLSLESLNKQHYKNIRSEYVYSDTFIDFLKFLISPYNIRPNIDEVLEHKFLKNIIN